MVRPIPPQTSSNRLSAATLIPAQTQIPSKPRRKTRALLLPLIAWVQPSNLSLPRNRRTSCRSSHQTRIPLAAISSTHKAILASRSLIVVFLLQDRVISRAWPTSSPLLPTRIVLPHRISSNNRLRSSPCNSPAPILLVIELYLISYKTKHPSNKISFNHKTRLLRAFRSFLTP